MHANATVTISRPIDFARVRKAVVFYYKGKRYCRKVVRYRNYEELCCTLFDNDCSGNHVATVVTGGKKYTWNGFLGHNCFAKGRITEGELCEMMGFPGYKNGKELSHGR